MSWDNVKATGRGKLEFRITFAGWPYQFVSHLGMEQTILDGRVRVAGLDRRGLVLEETAKPHLAELDGRAITARIVDRQVDDVATAAFFTLPTVTTWLDTDVTTAGTTLSTLSTAGLSAGDVVHVGTEAIEIGAVGADFTGCTRAYWDTIAQAHYTNDAADGLGEARVTDQPLGLEGRRAFLYVYGEGDPLTGDGTLVWRGICSTDAGLASDGCSWEISIDPITRVLEQEIGADLGEAASTRGIYYPEGAPLVIHAAESTTANNDRPVWGSWGFVYGFFENTDAFLEEVQTQLDTVTSGLAGTYTARGDDFDWWIECFTDSTNAYYPFMGFISAIDGSNGYIGPWTTGRIAEVGLDEPVDTVSLSTAYRTQMSVGAPGLKGVPRGYYGDYRPERESVPTDRDPPTTAPNNLTVHLDASFSLAGLVDSHVEASIGGATYGGTIAAADDVARAVTFGGFWDLHGGLGRSFAYHPGNPLEIQATLSLADDGNLADVRDFITTNSPTETNRARLPFITTEDLADWRTVVEANQVDPLTSQRNFYVVDSVSAAEYFREEFRMLGVFPALDSDGKITLRALDAPLATDRAAVPVTASEHLVDDGFAAWERNAWGNINAVRLGLRYSKIDDDYGAFMVVRDKGTYPNRKAPKLLEVMPKSRMGPNPILPREYQRQLISIGSRALGLMGRDYAIISGGVPLTLFDTLVGDKVLLTMDHIPDGEGGRGVTDEPALVVGRRWDLDQGRGEMQFLVQYQNLGGYTPAVRITAEADNGGNEWTLTVDSYDPDVIFQSFQDGHSLSDHFATDHRVEVRQWNTTAPTTQTGAVVSVTDAAAAAAPSTPASGTITVQFDGAVALGTGTWVLGYSDATDSVTAGQEDYVFLADSTGRVDFTTTSDAFVYAG